MFKSYLENPMRSKMVRRANEIADEQHKRQMRKFANEPYVNHPKRVAQLIKKYAKGKEAKQVLQHLHK